MEFPISKQLVEQLFNYLLNRPYSEVFDIIENLTKETKQTLVRQPAQVQQPAPATPPLEAANEPAQEEVPTQATAQ